MATLKLTIPKAKVLKNGKHKIRVAIYHKHETTYIPTNFILDSESQFKNGQVVKRPDASIINMKLRNLLNEYQEALDSIKNQSLYDCMQLKNLIIQRYQSSDSPSFKDVAASYINKLQKDGRMSYAILLERNCRYFCEFVRGDIQVQDITSHIICNYARFLREVKKLSETSVGMMLSRTKVIINRAINEYGVNFRSHPFVGCKIPVAIPKEVDISIYSFNKIRNAKPIEKKFRVARDLFCLSFYLGGMNLIDLLGINFKNTDEIEYVRTKSKNTTHGINSISLTIPDEAKHIIKVWMNKNTGRLDFGYKFSYHNFSRYVSRSIGELAESIGIKEKVVYYSARKSFAQYAFNLGVPDGIIDYCLGHSDKRRGVIRFYAKVRKQQADAAIAKVIDYVNNPEKYEDYLKLKRDIMMMQV